MQFFVSRTFSPEQISEEEARRVYNEIGILEEQYGNEFSGEFTLCEHTLTRVQYETYTVHVHVHVHARPEQSANCPNV